MPRHRARPRTHPVLLELAGYNEPPPESAPSSVKAASNLPHQATPTHDDAGTSTAAVQPPIDLLTQARWVSPRSSRPALALLLLTSLVAAVATGTGVVTRHSTPALAAALTCLVAASGLYAVLAAVRPVVVILDGVKLTVHTRGRHDRFNLASPFQDLHMSGRPGTRRWSLVLGCPDGHQVVLNRQMVDSRRLQEVVTYAQGYAERERIARSERFSR